MTYTFKALNIEHTFSMCQRHYDYRYHPKDYVKTEPCFASNPGHNPIELYHSTLSFLGVSDNSRSNSRHRWSGSIRNVNIFLPCVRKGCIRILRNRGFWLNWPKQWGKCCGSICPGPLGMLALGEASREKADIPDWLLPCHEKIHPWKGIMKRWKLIQEWRNLQMTPAPAITWL